MNEGVKKNIKQLVVLGTGGSIRVLKVDHHLRQRLV